MTRQLELIPENFERAMAIVAHPDDLEYGAASAIARWTRGGRSVAYVIVTDGEAGIDGLDPAAAGPLRQKEQVESAAVVGVEDVTFLGHRDGVVENGLDLRRDIARHIRRYRPEVLVTATYELTYGLSAGQRILNQADHRAVGLATLDAVADAGNRWLHTELTDEGLEPWGGVTVIAVAGSAEPTHYVDVSGEHFEASVHSLEAHAAYNAALPGDFPAPRELLGWILGGGGKAAGVEHALLLEVIRRG